MTTSALTAHIGTTMQQEYYARPADERYPDSAALAQAAQADRQLSREVSYNWRDLTFVADRDADRDAAGLYLQSPKAQATLSHWSFGQVGRMLQSPAGYLRDGLTPALAAACLNHRIHEQPHGDRPVLLVRAPSDARPLAQVRAITTDSYARIWDATLYGEIHRQLGERLTAPPTWDRHPDGTPKTGGAYRGDRDSTAVLISGGSIVTDPSARDSRGTQSGEMYRGVIVRNSEVGACAVHLISFLYRAICGNHLIWGVSDAKAYSRRHVGTKAVSDTLSELYRLARQLTQAGAAQDERIIRGLLDHEIAQTQAGVIDELQRLGWTKEQATQAYARCEQTETASPRSYWGIAQGATRVSQDDGRYQDERFELDKLAGLLLTRGRQLVTV